jgi:RNA polymerase-binding transcription factor DksA
MDGYGKCPDCGLDIPLNVEVCPYCSRNLDVKNPKNQRSPRRKGRV